MINNLIQESPPLVIGALALSPTPEPFKGVNVASTFSNNQTESINHLNNLSKHIDSFSKFIFLEAAEGARTQEFADESGKAHNKQKLSCHSSSSSLLSSSSSSSAAAAASLDIMAVQDNEDLKDDFSEFIEIPNLTSDNESEEVGTQLTNFSGSDYWNQKRAKQQTPASVVSPEESIFSPAPQPSTPAAAAAAVTQTQAQAQKQTYSTHTPPPAPDSSHQAVKQLRRVQHYQKTAALVSADRISPELFKHQRTQLMTIIVKYVATKIYNTFPPDSSRKPKGQKQELPLDKFLLLLLSRTRASLSIFLKITIYLFRYMDIIYLLRYLNQTNNFVQYNDMGFELKKLIVGCFKLTILKENKLRTKAEDKINIDWEAITGIKNVEINAIVMQLINRMNGKLTIKEIELVRMKNEMFRFVKMISAEN